jgi:predicted Ser/Thr protein kinase
MTDAAAAWAALEAPWQRRLALARQAYGARKIPVGAVLVDGSGGAVVRARRALGQEAAAVRRGDSPTRKDLEAEARKLGVEGRSKMGKDELKRAVARAR